MIRTFRAVNAKLPVIAADYGHNAWAAVRSS